MPDWCRAISDKIKTHIKNLGYERYKVVVEVVIGRIIFICPTFTRKLPEFFLYPKIGEQRGEGVRMGTRCLWDSDTDSYASDVFMNDSLFCCAAAFGIYYY